MATAATVQITNHEPTAASRQPKARRLSLVVFGIAAIVLIVHAWSFLPFISDDALISLRYSQRLLQSHGLTWTDGPRVEGYTNLLWVLACAGLGAFHVDLIVAARCLGFAGMLAALAAIIYANRPTRWSCALGPLAACIGLALTGPIAVWTVGGMEQPLVAAFLAWAVAFCLQTLQPALEETAQERLGPNKSRALLLASACLGLLCLTRADGGVLCIALALGLLAAGRLSQTSFKHVFLLAIFPVLLGGGQLIFRRTYYQEWLPNPARVKVAFTSERLLAGLAYLREAGPYVGGFVMMALFGAALAIWRFPLRRRTIFLVVAWLVATGYVVLIGGDVFPAHRHLVPTLVLSAFLVAQWRGSPAESRGKRIVVWSAAAAICAGLGAIQRIDPEVKRAVEERWEWDGRRVGELLRKAFGSVDPLIACDPAGCIPYFTGFRCIDMMGLNDPHIAHQRSAEFGRGKLGHELGDGKYVLDQRPDFILWSLPTGAVVPLFPSAIQMEQDPRFAQFYRLVYLRTPDPNPVLCAIWIRMDSEKVSIRADSNNILIPGWLAASQEETPAMLDGQGRLGVIARQDRPGNIIGFTPPAGRWRISADSDRVRFSVHAPYGKHADGAGEVTLNVSRGEPIDIAFYPIGQPSLHVREIVLTRL